MAENCSNDCSSCSQSCSERRQPEDFSAKLNEHSSVKKVIGVISGKGGVGKSMVTSMLSVIFNRRGFRTRFLTRILPDPLFPRRSVLINKRHRAANSACFPLRQRLVLRSCLSTSFWKMKQTPLSGEARF